MYTFSKLILSQLRLNQASPKLTKQELIAALANDINQFLARRPGLHWKNLIIDGQMKTVVVGEKTAYYAIPTPDNMTYRLQLTECHCSKYLDRSEPNNTRAKIEQSTVNTVLDCAKQIGKSYYFEPDLYGYHDYYDCYPITLINIGNDQIGLLSILAKLHLQNYQNIQVANLELQEELNFLNTSDNEFENLLSKLFPKVKYHKVYYNQQHKLSNTNMSSIINKIAVSASRVIIFAEDLGELTETDYQNYPNTIIVNNRHPKLSAVQYNSLIFTPAINNVLNFLDQYIKINQQVVVINYDGEVINELSKFREQRHLVIPVIAKPKL